MLKTQNISRLVFFWKYLNVTLDFLTTFFEIHSINIYKIKKNDKKNCNIPLAHFPMVIALYKK